MRCLKSRRHTLAHSLALAVACTACGGTVVERSSNEGNGGAAGTPSVIRGGGDTFVPVPTATSVPPAPTPTSVPPSTTSQPPSRECQGIGIICMNGTLYDSLVGPVALSQPCERKFADCPSGRCVAAFARLLTGMLPLQLCAPLAPEGGLPTEAGSPVWDGGCFADGGGCVDSGK